MAIDLEILDYDLEGAAYKDGRVVDGHALHVKFKRRPTVVDGVMTEGPGDTVPDRILVSDMTPDERARLFAAFQEIEAVAMAHAQASYDRHVASPKRLDEQIGAATRAAKELEQHGKALAKKQAELAGHDAALEAKRAELAALDAALAAAKAAEEPAAP